MDRITNALERLKGTLGLLTPFGQSAQNTDRVEADYRTIYSPNGTSGITISYLAPSSLTPVEYCTVYSYGYPDWVKQSNETVQKVAEMLDPLIRQKEVPEVGDIASNVIATCHPEITQNFWNISAMTPTNNGSGMESKKIIGVNFRYNRHIPHERQFDMITTLTRQINDLLANDITLASPTAVMDQKMALEAKI